MIKKLVNTILYIIVLAYAIVGGALIFAGFYVKNAVTIDPEVIPTKAIKYVGYFIIAVGFILLFVAAVGLIATCLGSYCLMMAFGSLSLMLLICEVIITILAFLLPSIAVKAFSEKFDDDFPNYKFSEPNTMYFIDISQKSLKCCGKDGPKDWLESDVDREHPSKKTKQLPYTCCKKLENVDTKEMDKIIKDSGKDLLSGGKVSDEKKKKLEDIMKNVPENCGSPDNIKNDGCTGLVKEFVESKVKKIAFIVIIVGLAQLAAIIFACFIAPTLLLVAVV